MTINLIVFLVLSLVAIATALGMLFSLNGYQGLDIFFAGYPASAAVNCGSSVEDAIEQTVTAGDSSLSYDAIADQYIYVWKTEKGWVNTRRTFVLRLNGGNYYRASFKFN
ncbi:MAG: PxKF domain-containing protein [Methylococcales bacterium]|nr:PxKF domain-containing protein [Methylococcales bacterium]